MGKMVVAILVSLIPMIPAVIYILRNRDMPIQQTRGLIMGLNGVNVILGLMAAGIGLLWLASPETAMAAGLLQEGAGGGDPYASLGAAISTGLACVGAGIAVGGSGAAAVGAIAEKPESFGRALIFVGLSEGIAIYGLIISFMVLNR